MSTLTILGQKLLRGVILNLAFRFSLSFFIPPPFVVLNGGVYHRSKSCKFIKAPEVDFSGKDEDVYQQMLLGFLSLELSRSKTCWRLGLALSLGQSIWILKSASQKKYIYFFWILWLTKRISQKNKAVQFD